MAIERLEVACKAIVALWKKPRNYAGLMLVFLRESGNILPTTGSTWSTKMHFRDRGQVVQIIRTKYDAATKKGKNEIVGRLSKSRPQISDALKSALSAAEQKEVAAWIDGNAKIGQLRNELAVRTLPEQLALAEEWFALQKSEEARVLAASLTSAWVRVRATLKRNGLVE